MINHKHPMYQKLSDNQKEAIILLHEAREMFEKAAHLDVNIANSLYQAWFELELALQQIWGFDYDPNYIRTWDYPYCRCPKLDNEDRYPTGHYVMNEACPIHGVDE